MLALKVQPAPLQVSSERIEILGDALRDEVNLAVWQRQLPEHLAAFASNLLAQGEPLAESLSIELVDPDAEPDLHGLLAAIATCPARRRSWPTLPGWCAPMPACSMRGGSACACARWMVPCAHASTSIMYRYG